MMKIRVVTEYREFLELKDQWNDLLQKSLHPLVFLTHQWIDTWWKAFGTGKSLFILLVHDGNELTAIAPLMIHEGDDILLGKPRIAIKARKIEFIANVHSNRADIILGNKPSESIEEIIKFLSGDCSNYWDIISLEYLLLNSASTMFLKDTLKKKNIPYKQYPLMSSPYLPINCTWNEYEQNLSKRYKNGIVRKIKKLSKKGNVILKKYQDTSDVGHILDQLFTIASKSWKEKENTALSSTEQTRAFYTDLAYTAAKEGWLELYILYLDAVPLVFDFSLKFENRLLSLKTEYDENYSEYSVGHALKWKQLEGIFDSGFAEYDLLGPSMPWKKIYCGENVKEHISLYVFNKNYKGYFLNFAHHTKDIFKKYIRHNGRVIWFRQRDNIKQHELPPLERDMADPAKEEIILEQENINKIPSPPLEKDVIIKPQNQNSSDIPGEEVVRLINERTKARQDHNWQRADEIREFLSRKGVELADSRQGTTWRYVNSNVRVDGSDKQ